MIDLPYQARVSGKPRSFGATTTRPYLERYGLAVLAFGIALAIRLLLSPLVGSRPVIVLFVSAVLLVAIFAGMGPAILTTGLVLTYDAVLKIRADNLQPADIINTLAFCLVVIEVQWVHEILRRTRSQADRASAAEQEWRALAKGLVDSSPTATIVVDPSGRIEIVSESTATLLGYQSSDLVGSSLAILFGPEWRTPADVASWLGLHFVAGQHRDGGRLPLVVEASAIWLEGRLVLVLYLRKDEEDAEAKSALAPDRDEPSDPSLHLKPEALGTFGARLAAASPRERQVLDCLIDGKSNKEIGIALGISPRTVERHRANLMKRMGASSLPDLVRMTVEGSALRPSDVSETAAPSLTDEPSR